MSQDILPDPKTKAAKKAAYRASAHGKAVISAYNAKYAAEHKEELIEYRKAHAKARSPEEIARLAAAKREWTRKNKEMLNERRREKLLTDERYRAKAIERSKLWYAANKEYVEEKQRQYYKENTAAVRARIDQYKKDNPERTKILNTVKVHRRRNRIKQSGDHFKRQDVERLLVLQKCKCANCKKSLKSGYHIDHRVPIAKGGDNGPGNIELLCQTCNSAKGAKMPHVFAQENGRLI
jgi:5-methylcytosine-specific restriction endonuclease McrA